VGKRSKRRPASQQPRAVEATGDSALLETLDLLAQRRAPYVDLLAGITGDVLARFPIGEGAGAVLELGAGTGALRAWLPAAIAARAVHTDPSLRALALLRGRHRDAQVAAARAERLPIRDRTCGSVLGLCVFDAIHAGGADVERDAVAEIARVLAPGGRFVHLLDMATLLDAPFAKLVAGGLVPIPNVFSDPAEHAWPLDILLLRRDWTAGLLELAARAGHSLAREFGTFFQPFLAPAVTFDAERAADAFKAVASDGERRFALSSGIASACQLAAQQGYPTFQPLPFHSGRYLASVLDTLFRDGGAFRVEHSEIVTRSLWRPAPDARGAPRYRSLALGHERVMAELPARLLDESARQPPPGIEAGATLVEAGAYAFVATRL
jgi:SAM-dependent methyltransferase